MTIELNGERVEVADGTPLLALVADDGGSTRGRAVVVDGDVVPRSEWSTFQVCDGARIELITAVHGG